MYVFIPKDVATLIEVQYSPKRTKKLKKNKKNKTGNRYSDKSMYGNLPVITMNYF